MRNTLQGLTSIYLQIQQLIFHAEFLIDTKLCTTLKKNMLNLFLKGTHYCKSLYANMLQVGSDTIFFQYLSLQTTSFEPVKTILTVSL